MKSILRKYICASCFVSLLVLTGCSKLVDVDTPPIYTSDQNAYATDATAVSVLNGIYASMSTVALNRGNSVNSFMSFFSGLSADEFSLYTGASDDQVAYYKNALSVSSGPNFWTSTYPYIYKVNLAIEGLTASKSLTPAVKNQLLGEAKFLRAFFYFYLVNLYGPVPLALTGSFTENAGLARAPEDQVYAQIIKDLTEASGFLNDYFTGSDGQSSTSERVVPSRWAAKAMLARVYLYTGKYSESIARSSEVIANTGLFGLTDLNSTFLKNSREAIWQLQPVNLGWNTEDARLFVIPPTGPSRTYPVSLDSVLLSSFETGDQRKVKWLGSFTAGSATYFFPYKYKNATLNNPVTEYQMVLRLAEQYLIRAEANAKAGNIGAAISDLNAIRTRAGLPNYGGAQTQAAVVNAILQERRIELFSEWGHRWLDLKRTGTVDSVMALATVRKGGTWHSYQQYYPIFTSELDTDPRLVQNAGY